MLAWLVIQVTDTVAPALGLPGWTLTFVTWVGIVGFPFVLLFSWLFELTPDGIKRETEVERDASITRLTGRRMDRAIIALLALALVVLIVDNYVMTPAVQEPAAVTANSGAALDDDGSYGSIGVLPFANMSADPEQEYFSDGIAEELLNSLARLGSLQVAARTSAFAFKGRNIDIKEIGQQLGVETVLEGSVRKAGNRVRVTAQLIDVSNGYHLWSDTFDRELDDIFAIQDEITAAIVEALKQHLDTGEVERVASSGTSSFEAYDIYLKGRHTLRSSGDEEARVALDFFRKATTTDPDFAPAWAARALTVMLLRETAFWGEIPREEARLLARNNIDRAMALDPSQAEAHVALGLLLADANDYPAALASLDRAVELNPNLSEAWTWRGRLLGRLGRIREAQDSMQRAMSIDPLNERAFFYAANLVQEYFDPAYYRVVREASKGFPKYESMLRYMDWATGGRDPQALKALMADPTIFFGVKARITLNWMYEIREDQLRQWSRNAGEGPYWAYLWSGQFEKGLAAYEALPPDRQAADINLEELSIAMAAQGRCEESLELLDRAHEGQVRIHGMISAGAPRSNLNLALNRAWCLRQLGRAPEAEPILRRAREFIDVLRVNVHDGYARAEAKLLLMEGDTDQAVTVLASAVGMAGIDLWLRYDPVLAQLAGDARFEALMDVELGKTNEFRAVMDLPALDATTP